MNDELQALNAEKEGQAADRVLTELHGIVRDCGQLDAAIATFLIAYVEDRENIGGLREAIDIGCDAIYDEVSDIIFGRDGLADHLDKAMKDEL